MKREVIIEEVVKMINEVIDECYERKQRNCEEKLEDVCHISVGEYEKDILDFGIDSLGYIRLIILFEGYYDFEFADEDITTYALKSTLDFYSAICNKMEE